MIYTVAYMTILKINVLLFYGIKIISFTKECKNMKRLRHAHVTRIVANSTTYSSKMSEKPAKKRLTRR
jgi:hypothetical protein